MKPELLIKTYDKLLTYFDEDVVHNTIVRLLERNNDRDNRNLAYRIARHEKGKEVLHYARFRPSSNNEDLLDKECPGSPEDSVYLKEILSTKVGQRLARHIAGHSRSFHCRAARVYQLRPELRVKLTKLAKYRKK